MSSRTLTRTSAREIDRRAVEEYGMSSLVLMENAGRGCADLLIRLGVKGKVVICAGKGNNGGDGLVLARHLDLRGVEVSVLLWAAPDELRGDAAGNHGVLAKTDVPIEVFSDTSDAVRFSHELEGASWVVDALLGTGARGEPRPPLDEVIEQLNQQQAPILAVDVPSGFDCDTGRSARCTVRAAHTCTFVAPKAGFLVPGAESYTGQVHVVDIGAPRKLVESVLATERPSA